MWLLCLRSKKETIYVYMTHPFWLSFSRDNLVHTNCDILFYDHTCDHARVTSKISFEVHYRLDNSVHTNCDFLNNHTCDLAPVTSKISLAYIFKVTH